MKINSFNFSYRLNILMDSFDDLDFEGNGSTIVNEDKTSDSNKPSTEDKVDLNGNPDVVDVNNDTSPVEENDKDGNVDDNSSTGGLEQGTHLDIDGVDYVVAENGDIVDANGNIFKEAKDVADWLKTVNTEEDNDKTSDDNKLSLKAIQNALDTTITDENGNEVEFTDDAEGVKSYVNSVLEVKSKELQEAAINKLFADNPLVKQFIDYCYVTGSPRGFGEVPDRSGIELDKDNEQQLEYVIRMAASEFGNKSLNDNYIKYLKSSGGLYDEAKAQLAALVEKDNAYRRELEDRAEQSRREEQEAVTNYWKNVNKVINNRVIAGYKIPDSFIKEVNGKKVTLTPNDFFNYLSRQTEKDASNNVVTGYQRDLNNLTDEELLNRELLDAWLMFTGGSYKDLVSMAINEEKVKTLRIKSKEQKTAKTIKIIKPQNGKVNIDDIVL